jgi:hypothetical protein
MSHRTERGRDGTKATSRRRKVLLWDGSQKLAQIGKAWLQYARSLFELVGLCVAEALHL